MPPIIIPAAAIPDFFRKSPREILLLITLGLIFNSIRYWIFRFFFSLKIVIILQTGIVSGEKKDVICHLSRKTPSQRYGGSPLLPCAAGGGPPESIYSCFRQRPSGRSRPKHLRFRLEMVIFVTANRVRKL